MTTDERFATAQEQVKSLTRRPTNEELLELYALFKQGSVGDVEGKRPGFLDLKGRAKYDAWAGKKGTPKDRAKDSYVALVERLVATYR